MVIERLLSSAQKNKEPSANGSPLRNQAACRTKGIKSIVPPSVADAKFLIGFSQIAFESYCFTELLSYCPTVLLLYCSTVLLPHSHRTLLILCARLGRNGKGHIDGGAPPLFTFDPQLAAM